MISPHQKRNLTTFLHLRFQTVISYPWCSVGSLDPLREHFWRSKNDKCMVDMKHSSIAMTQILQYTENISKTLWYVVIVSYSRLIVVEVLLCCTSCHHWHIFECIYIRLIAMCIYGAVGFPSPSQTIAVLRWHLKKNAISSCHPKSCRLVIHQLWNICIPGVSRVSFATPVTADVGVARCYMASAQ